MSSNPSPEEIAAAALNEHGFLLQQVVRKKLGIQTGIITASSSQRQFVAEEHPVTAADGSQTRIDLLFNHRSHPGVHLTMECKRPNPKYKKWIFFDRESNVAGSPDWAIKIETLSVEKRPAESKDIKHRLVLMSNHQKIPLFSYYVESAIQRDPLKKVSSTETIEDGFRQLMKGHSGLMAKFKGYNDGFFFRSIPVIVTTAEMVEAKFDPESISLQNGMIDAADLKLLPLEYCAVNYRADDSLSLQHLTPHERTGVVNDMMNSQIRTVFIVSALALDKFSNWAGHYLTDRE